MRKEDASDWQVIFAEFFGTWLMATLILGVKYAPNRRADTPHMVALFVGGSIVMLIKLGGWISGAAYNPSIGFALITQDPAFYDDKTRDSQLKDLFFYHIFCLLAAAMAFVWMRFLHLPHL